jgi:hypothetical protein
LKTKKEMAGDQAHGHSDVGNGPLLGLSMSLYGALLGDQGRGKSPDRLKLAKALWL